LYQILVSFAACLVPDIGSFCCMPCTRHCFVLLYAFIPDLGWFFCVCLSARHLFLRCRVSNYMSLAVISSLW
jgi:hypothetical protein